MSAFRVRQRIFYITAGQKSKEKRFSSIPCGFSMTESRPRSPVRFFTPSLRRPTRRRRTRVPALILRESAGTLRKLRRPASSDPASLADKAGGPDDIRGPLLFQKGVGGCDITKKSRADLRIKLRVVRSKPDRSARSVLLSSRFSHPINGREPIKEAGDPSRSIPGYNRRRSKDPVECRKRPRSSG